MLLNRSSALILHLYKLSLSPPPKLLLLQFNHSFSPKIRFFSLNQSHTIPNQPFSTASSVITAENTATSDTFFAEDAVSWTSLGLSNRLCRAISNSGLQRPSLVQAAAIPSILSGNDVVVAAETGSGKTHAYLLPLINKFLCNLPDDYQDSVVSNDQGLVNSDRVSLVLCPNVVLCEQVVRMASGLRGDNGEPLIKVAAVCGRQGWPVDRPDIVVSTPAAFLNNIDPKKQHRLSFIRGVKYVVLVFFFPS